MFSMVVQAGYLTAETSLENDIPAPSVEGGEQRFEHSAADSSADGSQNSSTHPGCVVLLHGLSRSARAMKPLARAFAKAGYAVVNVNYPSRHHPVEYLAPLAVAELGASKCAKDSPVNFVTHSLGGILVRQYLSQNTIANLARVVMLAPPNQGSEVVDAYRNVPGFRWLNGPAGMQLGTDEHSIPRQLPAADFDLGVIAGGKTFNPILSLQLPNPDDGKVSAESTRVEGMKDYLLLPVTHTFLMRSEQVINQALHFIQRGKFTHESE